MTGILGKAKEQFQRFRELIAQRIPVEIPVELGSAQFLWFDQQGRAKLLAVRRGFCLYPKFVQAILPIYEACDIRLPFWWIRIKSAILWILGVALLLAFPFAVIDLVSRWFPGS